MISRTYKQKEMIDIEYQENYHFTFKRYTYILIYFSLFFSVNYTKTIFKSNILVVICSYVTFTLSCIILTVYSIKNVQKIHKIKVREGYIYNENDLKFENLSQIILIALYCTLASILTGACGIIILATLFLQFKMIPQVMSGTN